MRVKVVRVAATTTEMECAGASVEDLLGGADAAHSAVFSGAGAELPKAENQLIETLLGDAGGESEGNTILLLPPSVRLPPSLASRAPAAHERAALCRVTARRRSRCWR